MAVVSFTGFLVLAGCSTTESGGDDRFATAAAGLGGAVRSGNPNGLPAGSACAVDHDCHSGNCLDKVCQRETCKDGILNGSETDVDCGGGGCSACGVGQQCFDSGQDCTPKTPDGAPATCFWCMPSAANPNGDCNIGRCEAVCGWNQARRC